MRLIPTFIIATFTIVFSEVSVVGYSLLPKTSLSRSIKRGNLGHLNRNDLKSDVFQRTEKEAVSFNTFNYFKIHLSEDSLCSF